MLRAMSFVAALLMAVPLGALAGGSERIEPRHLGSFFEGALPAGEEPLVIIVNRSNPVENLSWVELRKLFLGERRTWPHGERVTVVMREAGQPERAAVLSIIYRMNESDLNRYFMHAKFTGERQSAPKTLSSAAGVRKFVFNVPGAIGYVRRQDVDGSVKPVRVEGRAPGEAGYALKLPAT